MWVTANFGDARGGEDAALGSDADLTGPRRGVLVVMDNERA